jgi:hypothetical protein
MNRQQSTSISGKHLPENLMIPGMLSSFRLFTRHLGLVLGLLLPQFKMALPFHRRKVDASDAGDRNVVEGQVSNQPYLRRPVIALQSA